MISRLSLATIFLLQVLSVFARFRNTREEVWYDSKEQCSGPCWANYTEVSQTDYSIEIAWIPL